MPRAHSNANRRRLREDVAEEHQHWEAANFHPENCAHGATLGQTEQIYCERWKGRGTSRARGHNERENDQRRWRITPWKDTGRSGEIRTPDPLLPKQVRYQAALRSARPCVLTAGRQQRPDGKSLIAKSAHHVADVEVKDKARTKRCKGLRPPSERWPVARRLYSGTPPRGQARRTREFNRREWLPRQAALTMVRRPAP
jgi:hypothetical protein